MLHLPTEALNTDGKKRLGGKPRPLHIPTCYGPALIDRFLECDSQPFQYPMKCYEISMIKIAILSAM